MPDRIPVRSVRTGGLDFMEVPTAEEAYIAALRRERAGYEAQGLPERVAEVDAELARVLPATAPPQTKKARGTNQ